MHVDAHDLEARAFILKQQARLATSVANPWMVLVETKNETALAEAGIPLTNRAEIVIEFLNSVL